MEQFSARRGAAQVYQPTGNYLLTLQLSKRRWFNYLTMVRLIQQD